MRHHFSFLTQEEASRGQSLVELALMFPLLLFILVGVLDLGRAYYAYVTITNAAREGASYGAGNPAVYDDNGQPSLNTAGICGQAVAEAAGSGFTISCSNVTVTAPNGLDSGDNIVVSITANFQPIIGSIIGWGTVSLHATASMIIL
jgi:Flp pilus assembly protein TadG